MAQNVQNRLLCFFDILGFSNMVRNLSVDEIVTKFQSIFTTIFNVKYRKIEPEILKKVWDSRNWDECERDLELLKQAYPLRSKMGLIETKGKLDAFLNARRTFKYMIVSDSVIIYSEPLEENQNTLEIFCEFVSFRTKPLRGNLECFSSHTGSSNRPILYQIHRFQMVEADLS
ncbi:MAG TPA: hypothetical protein VMW67_07965 [Desulfobacteria bacterium]|nr:hypothetical protein [Desulfobacteria bacterium]